MTSIIIPVHNAEPWLEACLQSALATSAGQIIAVDDASTDASAEILARCRDPRLEVITLPVNQGVSAARNIGLDRARGEYVAFADADDCILPEGFDYLCLIIALTGADMAVGGVIEGVTMPSITPQPPQCKVITAHEALRQLLYQRNGWVSGVWNKIYRRELFKKVRFVEGVRYEDMEILPRLLLEARQVAVSSVPVYFYRQVPGSFMNTWSASRLDALRVTEAHITLMQQRAPDIAAAAEVRSLAAAFNMLGSMLAAGVQDDKMLDLCRDRIRRLAVKAMADPHALPRIRLMSVLSRVSMPLAQRLLRYKYR